MLSSIARWNLAVAEWLHGRLAEAERAFVSGIAGWRAAGQFTWPPGAAIDLGQVQRAQGRLDAAVQTYRQALECRTARPAASRRPRAPRMWAWAR